MGMPAKIIIDKFFGLRENNTGDLTLENGKLAKCTNIRITDNLKLKKREGYDEAFEAGSGGDIQSMWSGKVNSVEKFIFVRDGKIYDGNIGTGVPTQIGTVTDAKSFLFGFADKLYILNGNEYKVWTGTGNFTDVSTNAYEPLVAINAPPSGGGTPYEEINMLTSKKYMQFDGDASSTSYQLPETTLDSIDLVKVDGVTKTVTTDYTVNLTTGVVTPVTAADFTVGVNNVEVHWTKANSTLLGYVTANKQAMLFGGDNDTRVFLYGNGNKLLYSELADVLPSAEYFPESNSILIGSDNYDITGLTKQYDRLIIHKENESHYAIYEYSQTLGTIFSIFPLNDKVGNVAFGETRLIRNDPFVVTYGVVKFIGSNVRDERNTIVISDDVQIGLDTLDLTTAITFDWEKNYEYFISVGKVIYVYNYKIGCWYKFELADTPTCFIEIDGNCYFGTDTGKIKYFDTTKLTDDGTTITAEFETGYIDFGDSSVRKFLTYGMFHMNPEGKSYCEIDWISDQGSSSQPFELEYNLIDFGNVDFGDFSFDTNGSPKPFRRKLKAKKFSSIKIIGKNESDTKNMTILSITLPAVTGGQVK